MVNLNEMVETNLKKTNYIVIRHMIHHDDRINPLQFKEGYYYLKVYHNILLITGFDNHGLLNGVHTLLQLLPPKVYNVENRDFIKKCNIPQGVIDDAPEFSYRGFELDVSRTWRPAEDVYKVLEQMPSAQSEENCENCKHGGLKDSRCDNCRVGCINYPSYYERKTYG